MKVFIVEDNPNVREALAGYLKLEGYEVAEFGDLAGAERELKLQTPDLLVLDVMLPDGDGFLFAKQIKNRNGRADSFPYRPGPGVRPYYRS